MWDKIAVHQWKIFIEPHETNQYSVKDNTVKAEMVWSSICITFDSHPSRRKHFYITTYLKTCFKIHNIQIRPFKWLEAIERIFNNFFKRQWKLKSQFIYTSVNFFLKNQILSIVKCGWEEQKVLKQKWRRITHHNCTGMS